MLVPIIITIIYFFLPPPLKAIVMVLNFFIPDPIPIIDEVIMILGLLV